MLVPVYVCTRVRAFVEDRKSRDGDTHLNFMNIITFPIHFPAL